MYNQLISIPKILFSVCIASFKDHSSILKIKSKLHSGQRFNFNNSSLSEIVTEISNLKSSSAVGADGIPAKILKLCANECAPFLLKHFNCCLKETSFPESLKQANIVPIFKNGDSVLKKNYRPISILPAISKLYERILLKQINSYFMKLLSPILGGYKKGHSCQHSVLRLIEKWRLCLDQKGIAGTMLIDLSKAFDLIDHRLLIAKLSAYGFSNSALKLMLSYLSGRKQRVKINKFFSDWVDILSGVPQGSNFRSCAF